MGEHIQIFCSDTEEYLVSAYYGQIGTIPNTWEAIEYETDIPETIRNNPV